MDAEVRCLVVVDHIAHGRTLHVVTHGKEGWAEAKGADEDGIEIVWGANIAPLEITPGEKSVHFRFGSTDWYDGGREKHEDPAFYIQSYDYDLASGRKLHSTRNQVPAAKAEEKEMRTSLLYPPPAIQRLQKQRQ